MNGPNNVFGPLSAPRLPHTVVKASQAFPVELPGSCQDPFDSRDLYAEPSFEASYNRNRHCEDNDYFKVLEPGYGKPNFGFATSTEIAEMPLGGRFYHLGPLSKEKTEKKAVKKAAKAGNVELEKEKKEATLKDDCIPNTGTTDAIPPSDTSGKCLFPSTRTNRRDYNVNMLQKGLKTQITHRQQSRGRFSKAVVRCLALLVLAFVVWMVAYFKFGCYIGMLW